ncbi:MAG: choice-of-anchor R domain-containing protein [Candidatus Micrarchaeaceae archaeon]
MSIIVRGQQGDSIGNAVEGGGFCFASTTYSEGCSKGPLDAGLLENGANITEGCTNGPLDLGFLDNGANAEAGNDSSGGGPTRSDAPAFPTTGTFGNSAAGISYTPCINQIDGSTFTTPTVPGSVWLTGIHALVQCDTANKTFNAAIYTSAKALVGQCNAVAVAYQAGSQLIMFTPTSAIQLASNTTYILVVWCGSASGNGGLYYIAGSTNQGYTYASTYSGTFPSSLGTITFNNDEYCVYADYYVF